MRLPRVDYRREQWQTPDGDFIELDWLLPEADAAQSANKPLVALFHGLEGSARSHYALRLMSAVREAGWHGVVVHFRGCGGAPNRLPRGYHSGDSDEIDWILRRLRAQHAGRIYAVGFSLGGNALLKWLGERKQTAKEIVDKAAAVSAPLALPTTGHVLGRGFNRFYAWRFLKTLKPKALAMIAQHGLAFDVGAIRKVRNLWHYDGLFTAPLHGFKDADDYWHQANCRPYLVQIQVPTLLLNARNDPFLPERDLPQAEEVSPQVVRDFPTHGGHAGFAGYWHGAAKNRQDWLAQRILYFLENGR
jgi:predicted alpha/beta-fold hydrolase